MVDRGERRRQRRPRRRLAPHLHVALPPLTRQRRRRHRRSERVAKLALGPLDAAAKVLEERAADRHHRAARRRPAGRRDLRQAHALEVVVPEEHRRPRRSERDAVERDLDADEDRRPRELCLVGAHLCHVVLLRHARPPRLLGAHVRPGLIGGGAPAVGLLLRVGHAVVGGARVVVGVRAGVGRRVRVVLRRLLEVGVPPDRDVPLVLREERRRDARDRAAVVVDRGHVDGAEAALDVAEVVEALAGDQHGDVALRRAAFWTHLDDAPRPSRAHTQRLLRHDEDGLAFDVDSRGVVARQLRLVGPPRRRQRRRRWRRRRW